uniref:Putative vacuolar protein n=1 Tax=Ixodes ricinus TaxID=34613 RepID=V5IC59_IXORI
MHHVVRALMTLQTLYGVIPNVYGKGEHAQMVSEMMVRMRRELSGREPQLVPQIENLLLLDRAVDLLTPLATQLTYQGLLDEIFGVHHNIVKVPPEKFQGEGESKQFCLNSAEELFAELRDRNFQRRWALCSVREAKSLSSQYDVRHEAKTIPEIKQFVDRLPSMQLKKKSLANHTSMAELIKEVTDQESFFEATGHRTRVHEWPGHRQGAPPHRGPDSPRRGHAQGTQTGVHAECGQQWTQAKGVGPLQARDSSDLWLPAPAEPRAVGAGRIADDTRTTSLLRGTQDTQAQRRRHQRAGPQRRVVRVQRLCAAERAPCPVPGPARLEGHPGRAQQAAGSHRLRAAAAATWHAATGGARCRLSSPVLTSRR